MTDDPYHLRLGDGTADVNLEKELVALRRPRV
jgi:hypothetical protein